MRFLQVLSQSLILYCCHQALLSTIFCSAAKDDSEEEGFRSQPSVQPTEKEWETTGECVDAHSKCEEWANDGECLENPSFMTAECRKSCDTCLVLSSFYRNGQWQHYEDIIDFFTSTDADENAECEDYHVHCSKWQRDGHCETNPDLMNAKCPFSCKTCQSSRYYHTGGDLGVLQSIIASDGITPQDIQWMIGKARNYIKYVHHDPSDEACKNHHRLCAYWAARGECSLNESYMNSNCAPVCNTCGWLDSYEARCPIDPNAKSAWGPGDLDRMFQRLILLEEEYDVTVLSSPSSSNGAGPWVITLENVVSPAEAQRLVELGYDAGYERSTEVGRVHSDGSVDKDVTPARTSTNAWCTDESCFNDNVARRVMERLSNLTNIPQNNGEYLQLLRYEPGQYYHTHHDYIHHHMERQHGVRILTVFLYLNDVKAGGGTKFDALDVTVEPKLGRAVIWPSTLNESPNEMDERTAHQALPVEDGIKYGANIWFHQFDFQTPDANGCVE